MGEICVARARHCEGISFVVLSSERNHCGVTYHPLLSIMFGDV